MVTPVTARTIGRRAEPAPPPHVGSSRETTMALARPRPSSGALRTRTARFLVAATIGSVTAAGLVGAVDGDSDSTRRAAASGDDHVDQVVVISVDGLKPAAIRQLGRDGTPGLHRMMRQGAATLNARSSVERTITLPNHTGMVTGRRVAVRRGGHGVTFNEDDGSTVHRHAREYAASMFSVAHDRGRSTALYVAKDKFDLLNRSWNGRYGAVDRVGANQGRDKIDRYALDTEPRIVDRLLARLRNAPDDLSFVHLAEPDRAGHARGWGSRRYLDAVRAADRQVRRILATVAADASLRAHTVVLLTSDHGGYRRGHSDAMRRANYTVPFMAWGAGVPARRNLYDLNEGTRRDPGRTRPGYSGTPPIRNGEVANLALDLLDLPAVPGSLFDRRQDLSVM